jgi:ribonuclease III
MSDRRELESVLGHPFSDASLLRLALVHSSMRSEGEEDDNEVLEFLGDAVLDLAISDLATEAHPGLDEGRLTRMRAALVNARQLAELGRAMGIGDWLRLGKGELQSGGSDKDRILATAVEALFGAVFRDAGYEKARDVIRRHFGEAIEEGKGFESDAKTDLQELTQEHFKVTPEYHTLDVSGPDHEKQYRVEVRLQERTLGEGAAASRKQAEQIAARDAGRKLRAELKSRKDT